MCWLTNRIIEGNGFGTSQSGLTYWTLKAPGLPLNILDSWQQQRWTTFKQLLIQTSDQFPNSFGLAPEKQRHVCLFIHGYNVTWTSAMNTYGNLATQLFDGPDSLGELIPERYASSVEETISPRVNVQLNCSWVHREEISAQMRKPNCRKGLHSYNS